MNNLLIKLASFSAQKAILVGALLTGFWYMTLFNDGTEIKTKLENVNKGMVAEKAKEKESDLALKEIAAVQASVGQLTDQFKLVSAQLPTDIQNAEIIRTIDKISQATGLVVKGKEPKASTRDSVLELMPLKISAEGVFSEMTMFFYYLSTIERIVRIKSFVVSAPLDYRKMTKLSLEAEVVSYRFIGQDASKTAEAAKK